MAQCVPLSGTCTNPGECSNDSDCAFPEICNPDIQRCATGCTDDESCPDTLVCQGGHCIPPCDEMTSPCSPGQTCEEGHCKVPGGCIDSSDCPEKETYCDLEAQKCVTGCKVDFDCKDSSKECANNTCVSKSCPGNYYCGFGEVCSQLTGECEPAPGPHCDPCESDNDTTCEALSPDNLCADFQDEDGKALGSYCLVSCGSDAENPCPQGYSCTSVDLGDQGTKLLCVRECPVPPVGAP